MNEKAFLFGEPKTMLGVLTEPAFAGAPAQPDPAVAGEQPAIIILNSGIVHRIGPARNTVRVARRLAADGFAVLRLDLSGIGDSEPRADTLSFEERAVVDVGQAMDHLEKTRGLRSFVLMGLCSGADNSYLTALRDPRVVGAVLIDGYGYQTPGFYLRHFAQRAMHLVTERELAVRQVRTLSRRLRRAVRKHTGQDAGAAPADDGDRRPPSQADRPFPPREEFARGVRALVDRGVHLYFIYTAGMHYYNYRQQLADSLPEVDFKGRVDTDYFPSSDHTFTDLRQQISLVESVAAWTRRTFPLGLVRRAG